MLIQYNQYFTIYLSHSKYKVVQKSKGMVTDTVYGRVEHDRVEYYNSVYDYNNNNNNKIIILKSDHSHLQSIPSPTQSISQADTALILLHLNISTQHNILEVGHGSGIFCGCVARRAARVDSVDVCVRKCVIDNVRMVVGDIHEIVRDCYSSTMIDTIIDNNNTVIDNNNNNKINNNNNNKINKSYNSIFIDIPSPLPLPSSPSS